MDGNANYENQQYLRILNVAIALAVLCCGIFIYLLDSNHSTVNLNNLPADATIRVNGHTVNGRSVQLRPGSYEISVSSPTTMPYIGTLSIGRLQMVDFKPSLTQRSANAIASAAIGTEVGSNTSEVAQLTQIRWFSNNTWLVGLLQSGTTELALQYDSAKKTWDVRYYGGGGYPHDASSLPADVAAYVNVLEAEHA